MLNCGAMGVEQDHIIPQMIEGPLVQQPAFMTPLQAFGAWTNISSVVCLRRQIIEVKFEKFDVERDNYCRYDHVSIFNGAEINDAKRIGKYCGDSPPA